MKGAIVQSSFIPWRGYFDIIREADIFVIYDDVQYTSRDWRNRNKLKTFTGTKWLTVPVQNAAQQTKINEIKIDQSKNWIVEHHNAWQTCYKHAPFLSDVLEILELLDINETFLSDLNAKLIRKICSYLNITTKIINSSELEVTGVKTERLIRVLQTVGCNQYITGPSASNYIDETMFKKNSIEIFYKNYEYKEYNQQHGVFEPHVSVLDLIANVGSASAAYIRST